VDEITRTIIPVGYQPSFTDSSGGVFGLGDVDFSAFFAPPSRGNVTVGIGPDFLLDTATHESLGTGKWSIGPAAVVVWTPGKFLVGGLLKHFWSFAGDGDRADVNLSIGQPFISYNLPKGWYIATAPLITANWEATSGNVWTVPVGGGFGRVFALSGQKINSQLQAFYNVVHPDAGPDWSLRFQIQLLFPR
jgi:hypothetical protein